MMAIKKKSKSGARPGRKPKPPDQKRGKRKELAFTAAEWMLITEKADAAGKEVGVWAREAVVEKAVR
jgi:hypothetical protein